MKIFFCFIAFFGLSFNFFAQVKSLNSENKSRVSTTNEFSAKPLSESKSTPTARIKLKQKIKQVPRKENHEIAPKMD